VGATNQAGSGHRVWADESKEIGMLQVRDHGVHDYTALLDMDATDVGVLSEADRDCLRDLGEYLVSTQASQRFAMWLLHKHFEPGVGEVFVERAIREEGKTETTLADRSAFAENGLHATGIRFSTEEDADLSVIGMEFAEPDDFGVTAPLSTDDETVLANIAERLRTRGKLDRFGVKLIRNPLGLADGELLLETYDSAERTLSCNVSLREAIPADLSVIETTWRWKLVQGQTRPVVMQDCTAGCVSVGEGHDLSHKHSQTDNDDNPIP
jgi:hypothetical protein